MQVIIKKWGNSPSVRIPASVMKEANLALDDVVDVHVENGRVIVEPVYPAEINLSCLIAAITPENIPDNARFGFPVDLGQSQ